MFGNVIAITFYNKPELLHQYLEQLLKSKELHHYKLHLHTEEGYDEEEDYVIHNFRRLNPRVKTRVFVKKKTICPLVGFSNILTSYTISAREDCDFVIVGEEDILPTEDYLRFNRTCYEKYLSKYDRIMCVAHKRRPETEKTGDPELLIGDYQLTSPSCISRKAILKYMKPVIENRLLFENPISFYHKHYANSRIHPCVHTHHDGFIERIMEANKLFVLKPDQTRSMHVGLSGIFCGGKAPIGKWSDRLDEWRSLIRDGDRLRSLSNMPHDIVVTDPVGPKWEDLRLDLDRTAKASSWWYDTENDFKEYINGTR